MLFNSSSAVFDCFNCSDSHRPVYSLKPLHFIILKATRFSITNMVRSQSNSWDGRDNGCIHCQYLKCDIDSLDKKLDEYSGWCEGLDKALQHRLAELKDSKRDVSWLEKELNKTKKSSLFKENRTLKESIRELKKQIAREYGAKKEAFTKNAALSKQSEEANSRLLACKSERNQARQDIDALRTANEKTLAENHALRKQLENRNNRLLTCQSNRDQAQKDNATLLTELDQRRRDNKLLTKNLEELRKGAEEAEVEKRQLVVVVAEKSNSLKQHRKQLEWVEARNLALDKRVTNLEAVHAVLQQSTSTCWLHRVRCYMTNSIGLSKCLKWAHHSLQSWDYIRPLHICGAASWTRLSCLYTYCGNLLSFPFRLHAVTL